MSALLIVSFVSIAENSHMDKHLLNKLAKRIKFLRKEKGMSQEELAFEANVSRSMIGMIETAQNDITLSKLNRIAKVLGISLYELLQL